MISFTKRSVIQFEQETVEFNGGELHPKVKWSENDSSNQVEVLAHIRSSKDLVELLLVKDAIDRLNFMSKFTTRLILPYVPYARQDRVANTGEALGIKVACDLINNLKFDKVTVSDVHSPVTLALLNNVMEIPQYVGLAELYYSLKESNAQDIILAPDAGAMKKAHMLGEKLELPVLTATKSRNSIDGKLSKVNIQFTELVSKDFVEARIDKGGRLIVVDDICDFGGTFLGLGAELVEEELLYNKPQFGPGYKGAILLVTHGIFARDAKDRLSKYFERVEAVYDWAK